MPDPQWKPAYDCHVTWNTVALTTTTNQFSMTHATFDTTNDQGAGWSDFGVAERTASLRFTLPVDAGVTDGGLPTERDLVNAEWTDGIKTYAGKGRITSAERSGGGKGGYFVNYTAQFAGSLTIGTVAT